MYSIRPNLILGFHGCDKELAMSVLNGKTDLNFSTNEYDWLGTGIYFWENDNNRAFEFAKEAQNRNPEKIKEPFVLGAVLCLHNCLDLTTRKSIERLSSIYKTSIEKSLKTANIKENKGAFGELYLRYKDCYVLNSLHQQIETLGMQEYDSVKAAFWEGDELYPTAGFRKKNHIQICIRNPKCILGYFLPRNI